MTYGQLREKHTDRIVIMAVTEIVTAGIQKLSASDLEGPSGAAIKACLEDIKNSTWNDIRAIVKRSL